MFCGRIFTIASVIGTLCEGACDTILYAFDLSVSQRRKVKHFDELLIYKTKE